MSGYRSLEPERNTKYETEGLISTSAVQWYSNDEIPCLSKLIYAAPAAAATPFLVMFATYGNSYYTLFGAETKWIAFYTALSLSVAIIVYPVMTYMTDASQGCGGIGRRRPYMCIGCFFYSAVMWFLVDPPYAQGEWLNIWYGIFAVLFGLAMAFTLIPYDSLGAELSDDSWERTKLYGFVNFFEGLGMIFALMIPAAMSQTVAATTQPNEFICKSESTVVNECINGLSCKAFQNEGKDSAFLFDATLAPILFPFRTKAAMIEDWGQASKNCLLYVTNQITTVLGNVTYQEVSTREQNDAFCECIDTCNNGCEMANKRLALAEVGHVLGIWFVVAMLLAACCIRERTPRPQTTPPVVPAWRQSANNPIFGPWFWANVCDWFGVGVIMGMLPFFIEGVISPEYMTMEGKEKMDCYPSSPTFELGVWKGSGGDPQSGAFDWKCRSEDVYATAVTFMMIFGVVAIPFWFYAIRWFGKINVWSDGMLIGRGVCFRKMSNTCRDYFLILVAIVANPGFSLLLWGCFDVKAVHALVFYCCVYGINFGARFMNDSILADIVDYDEFLSGQRREGTYFMYKSFLPKIALFCGVVLPVAMVMSPAINYKPDIGGMPREQNDTGTMMCIWAWMVIGWGCNIITYCLKSGYKLKNNEDPTEATEEVLIMLRRGLEQTKTGRIALDPITATRYRPFYPQEGLEEELYHLLIHFDFIYLSDVFKIKNWPEDLVELRKLKPIELDKGADEIHQMTWMPVWISKVPVLVTLLCTVVAIIFGEKYWASFFVLLFGFSVLYLVYCQRCRSASLRLKDLVVENEITPLMVARILRYQDHVREGKSARDWMKEEMDSIKEVESMRQFSLYNWERVLFGWFLPSVNVKERVWTSITSAVKKGATEIPVEGVDGFVAGKLIRIGEGHEKEDIKIKRFGSIKWGPDTIVLEKALAYEHEEETDISQVASRTQTGLVVPA